MNETKVQVQVQVQVVHNFFFFKSVMKRFVKNTGKLWKLLKKRRSITIIKPEMKLAFGKQPFTMKNMSIIVSC